MTESDSRYARFMAAYQGMDTPPWDTGIVPPEVRALVQVDAYPPGVAVDVGCGTGISAVYLALHGWRVTGVDWIDLAVERAQTRAKLAGLAHGEAHFVHADVTETHFLAGHPPVDLWLDVGCMHGLSGAARLNYAAHAAHLVRPGGVMRLYAWRVHDRGGAATGIDPAEVALLFAPAFRIVQTDLSHDGADQSRPAAWYRLVRQ